MAHAEIITLWQDDGNGHDVADYFLLITRVYMRTVAGRLLPTRQINYMGLYIALIWAGLVPVALNGGLCG